MSKHISRKRRWAQEASTRYASDLGTVVYERNAWYGVLRYQTLRPEASADGLPQWQAHTLRLGPFRRPRNAMVTVEREATALRNRHGDGLRLNDELWGEARR